MEKFIGAVCLNQATELWRGHSLEVFGSITLEFDDVALMDKFHCQGVVVC